MKRGRLPGEPKAPAPYERKDNALVNISPETVNKLLRDYARSLNLRGYPADDANVTVEFHEVGWKDQMSYIGAVLLRFEVE